MVLLLVGTGCGGQGAETAVRDAYCNALEAPMRIGSDLERASRGLTALRMALDGLSAAREDSPFRSVFLWQAAGACETAASAWGEAVGSARAFHETWWDVRLASGVLVVEPPDGLVYSKELQGACGASTPMRDPPDLAADVRVASERRQAAVEELERERARWARARDAGLARCVASGWSRRHEPGDHGSPTKPSSDAATP